MHLIQLDTSWRAVFGGALLVLMALGIIGCSMFVVLERSGAFLPRNPTVSPGVGTMGAEAWHRSGFTGKGITIAILATGFDGFDEAIRLRELPPRALFASCSCGESSRGVALAEIAHDVAEGARFRCDVTRTDSKSVYQTLNAYSTLYSEDDIILIGFDLTEALLGTYATQIREALERIGAGNTLVISASDWTPSELSSMADNRIVVGGLLEREDACPLILPYAPRPTAAAPDVLAPGTAPTATYGTIRHSRSGNPYPFYGAFVGAAHVAGAAALLMEAYPDRTAGEIIDILVSSAEKVVPAQPNRETGAGSVRLPSPPR